MKKDRFSIIGQSLPKIDAWAKVVGETKFADDMVMSRMAHGKLLRSPHPHALIKRIDTTRARALPGVYAVITGHDLPRVKFGILPVSQDEEALCVEKVRMVGDAVAAVAAVDEETAERATELIEVEYEPLRPLMSIEDSLKHPEVRIHEYGDRPNVHKAVSLQFGDVEAAFASADLVREDVFYFEGNTHLPMEQHSALAQWGADGKLTLWSSTQTPHYVHRLLSKILDVPQAHIRVVAAPVGGGFGGKLDPFAHEIAACKLSQLTGRPVKFTLTREEVFYVHRGRHPVLMWIKTGFKKDGAITGMHFRSWLDGGAYGSYGVASTFYTGALQTVTYKIPVYKFEGARVFTNKPPCGPKRGHGTPQPRFAMECQIDKAAEQLGLDPADMRRRNLAEPFVKTANHLTVTTIGLGECIDRVVEASGWREKRGNLPPGKGIGIACSSYLTGAGTAIYWNDMPHSGVVVRADRSGLVAVLCGATDIGQGSDSILAYLVAEVLGIEPKDIRVHPADTDLTPVDLGSYSSRVTLMAGNAAIQAAERLREKIFAAVARKLEVGRPARGRRAPRVRAGRSGARRLVPGGGRAGREHVGRAGLPRLLRAAQARGQVQGRRRRPLALLLLLGLRGRGGRGSPDRHGHAHRGVDRPRRRPGAEPAAGGGPGRGLDLHGPGRGADGGAGLPQGRPQDPLAARVQEPDDTRDAGDPHDPRGERRSGGPVRRQGGRAGPAAAGDPGGGQRGLRRGRRADRRDADHAREGDEGDGREAPGEVGAARAGSPARVHVPGAEGRRVGVRAAGGGYCGEAVRQPYPPAPHRQAPHLQAPHPALSPEGRGGRGGGAS